ncbi:MAG: dihydropteroate synthase, partial [Thermocrispum sp.]
YADVVKAVLAETCTRAAQLVDRGVPRDGILIDPTHDFGKNTWHGHELLRRARELTASGWPVLMALSNKDFIGETLAVGIDDRHEGTLAATVVAAHAGVAVFRAHDVAGTAAALDTLAAIRDAGGMPLRD